MLTSMTGYGRHVVENDQLYAEIELKTLNSKFLDLQIKVPKYFADKEIEIRQRLTNKLKRGKVAFSINFQDKEDVGSKAEVNHQLFENYFDELLALNLKVKDKVKEEKIRLSDIFRMTMEIPEVFQLKETSKDYEQAWVVILDAIDKAIIKCEQHRLQEGRALQEKLNSYIDKIETDLNEIKSLDPERGQMMKDRLKQKLGDLENLEMDENRLEQELIYYLEKFDIAEEKVRLQAHIGYFREIIAENQSQGKKLGFISQEIGREINTIGSKANHANIQRLVVSMKEELEKVKEQVLNLV